MNVGDAESIDDTPPATAHSGARWKRVLSGLLSTIIVVGIFAGALPLIADYSDVWPTIGSMPGWAITLLTVIGLGSIPTYWYVKMAVLPGLTVGRAALVHLASTAVSNTLPAGGMVGLALTHSMLRSWGFGNGDFALAALVSGAWNNLVRLGLPVVALVLLAIRGGVTGALVVAAVVGVGVLMAAVIILAMAMRSPAAAARVGGALGAVVSALRRPFRKPAVTEWPEAAVRFSEDTSTLVAGRWLPITAATLVSHLSLFAVLLTTLRLVGVSGSDVHWIAVFAGFAFVRLISALPITPGGLGVVELGYAAILGAGLGGPAQAQIVAAVLVFRFITYVLPIPLGSIGYVIWRRKSKWRVAAPAAIGA